MSQLIIDFLKKLSENNNREWFLENKKIYDQARGAFLSTVDQLITGLVPTNPGYAQIKATDTVFRINRDLRFSKDKSPYKTQFGSYLAPGGRKSPMGGHYFHVEPGNCFLAGGIYCPEPENLRAIRSEIYFDLSGYRDIVTDKSFVSLFGEVKGSRLKNPPKEFPKDFEGVDYLKFKDFTIIHPISDEQLNSSDFVDQAVSIFEAMNPFNHFLNKGISNKPDNL